MAMHTALARRGFTLVELLMAATVVGIALIAMVGFIATTFRSTSNERDRAFAIQKSLQIMEEVAAYKATGPTDKGIDKFASGPVFSLTTADNAAPDRALSGNPLVNGKYRFVRDIRVALVTGDPTARVVTVEVWYADKSGALASQPGSKPLAVMTNVLHANQSAAGPVSVLDVYALSIENMPHVWRDGDSRQYYPSAADARRNFEASLRDIQSLNTSIAFRVHYITRLSVGRDSTYRPYMNVANPLDTSNGGTGVRDALNSVYFYPGLVEKTTGNTMYYDPTAIKGQLTNDGTPTTAVNNPYALCDQFNQAVRYPLEFNASDKPLNPDGSGSVITAGNPGFATSNSLSLRQFLEDLLSDNTEKYRNAILVNLNGEMFPCLPLRNYSDAAKDTTDTVLASAKRRLVTHPYKLNFPAPLGAVEKIRLLVHPFMSDGGKTPSSGTSFIASTLSTSTYATNAKIIIPNLKSYLADANLDTIIDAKDITIKTIQRVQQGMGMPQKSSVLYELKTAWSGTGQAINGIEPGPGGKPHSGPHVTAAHGSGADPVFNGNDLVIEVTDLDFDARETATSGSSGPYYGIPDKTSNTTPTSAYTPDTDYLVHGLQYFPDPYLATLDQAQPAAPAGSFFPRNTARVIIEFQIDPLKVAAGQRCEVDTQLMKASGAYPTTANDPANSISWFYVKDALNANKVYPIIPRTEQLQLVGDPRHNPYSDMRVNGLCNPHFTDFTAGQEVYKTVTNASGKMEDQVNAEAGVADLPASSAGPPIGWNVSFPGSDNAWAKTKYNAPAYFRLWREALMRNNMIYVNVTGEPVRFLGLGGEFSLQRKVNAIGDLHISKQPYDGSSGDANGASEEFLNQGGVLIERANGDRWHCLPWLGELYPADQASTWSTPGALQGNLSTAGAGGFYRVKLSQLNVKDLLSDRNDGNNQKLVDKDVGFASLWNSNASGAGPISVNPQNDDDSAISTTGLTVANALRMQLAATSRGDFWYDNNGGTNPPEWGQAPYSALRTVNAWLDKAFTPKSYVNHSGSGDFAANAMLITDLAVPTQQAIVVASSLKAKSVTEPIPLMDLAMTFMVGAYYDGTQGASNTAIKPLPRVKIKQPPSGTSVSGASVALSWYAKWVRSDGTVYSPLYTYNNATQAPLPVVFYVKYKNQTANGPYCTAKLTGPVTSAAISSVTDVTADAGNIPTDATVKFVTDPGYPSPATATWVFQDPTGTALPNGTYLLRIEAYRKDGANPLLPTHYAYHEIPVTISN